MIAKLPRETEEQIQRLIETGNFEDGESVLVRAVDVLARRQAQREHLEALLQPAIDQVERGDCIRLTQDLVDQKWEAALKRYYARLPQDDRANSR
jgi:Arc/MetJ-type ribon-helix-helix transcriptional regulator